MPNRRDFLKAAAALPLIPALGYGNAQSAEPARMPYWLLIDRKYRPIGQFHESEVEITWLDKGRFLADNVSVLSRNADRVTDWAFYWGGLYAVPCQYQHGQLAQKILASLLKIEHTKGVKPDRSVQEMRRLAMGSSP